MNVKTDAVFSALADPTRRQLLEWLQQSESGTATEYALRLPISRQAVTKHLGELEAAGILSSRRSGRETRYSYTDGGLLDAAAWIEARERSWVATLERLRSVAESGPVTDH
jgi:DNA-binding transcriptional ArsR family regulator